MKFLITSLLLSIDVFESHAQYMIPYRTNILGQKEPFDLSPSYPKQDEIFGSYEMPIQQVHHGTKAQDISDLVVNGIPQYTNDPVHNQQVNTAMQQQQMRNDPAYNPALRNPNSRQAHLTPTEEVLKLLRDESRKENPAQSISNLNSGYYSSPAFAKEAKPYTDALRHLKNMLSGKEKLSVANAYFAVENAYGDNYLTQKQYNDILDQSAAFIKSYAAENGLDEHSSEDMNLAIQKFMSEKTSIGTSVVKLPGDNNRYKMQSIARLLFSYDFNDYQGEKDYRNYFLTKLLATGSGQCNSMPAGYLALAERLGVPAYLTTAPQHSFIKYPDGKGNLVNYEPTSNWKMSDKWYQDNMAISPDARRSGLYLDTFNRRQIVADCILHLATGYMQKYGSADSRFVTDCIAAAASQFAKPNALALFIKSAEMVRMLQVVSYDAGLQSLDDIRKSKEALELYQAIVDNEALLKQLGYTEQPKELYEHLVKEQEFKGKVQMERGITGKEKRSMFIKSN